MPTAAQFKARFPEFSCVSDALVDQVLAETTAAVGDGWVERDRLLAINYLTAHMLAMEGEPDRSKAIVEDRSVANAQSGPVSSVKIGDVAVTYAGKTAEGAGSGMGPVTAEYQKTDYGQRYYTLLRKNFAGALAV